MKRKVITLDMFEKMFILNLSNIKISYKSSAYIELLDTCSNSFYKDKRVTHFTVIGGYIYVTLADINRQLEKEANIDEITFLDFFILCLDTECLNCEIIGDTSPSTGLLKMYDSVFDIPEYFHMLKIIDVTFQEKLSRVVLLLQKKEG